MIFSPDHGNLKNNFLIFFFFNIFSKFQWAVKKGLFWWKIMATRKKTIYRCDKDEQTQFLVISDFWIFNFCHTDFCKPFSWIFNFCKKSNNQKTARTKSRFSKQLRKLGIEVGGVLKPKNRAEQLLLYTLNKKKRLLLVKKQLRIWLVF